jgi:2-oxoglutarate ferredoxin oxidoreductase subunit gamma
VQLVVSRTPVLYPYLTAPHVLVAMSQEAYAKFSPHLREGGTLIIEEELVRPDGLRPDILLYPIPATRLAEELKRRIVLNMVLVGFFAAVTQLLTLESARRAVSGSVPPGTEALNLAALEKGHACAATQLVHTST